MLSHKELAQEEQDSLNTETDHPTVDNAFNDETDLKNEDFIYIY